MKMRHVIACVGVAALLTAPLGAQQQTEEERRRVRDLAEMLREVERQVNLAARRVRNPDDPAAQPQGGGGRGARSGGAAAEPQAFDPRSNDPMSGPVVANAPFSADAVTTVTQVLGDGTRIDQRANAKFYRDGTGRIRREQTIVGMDWANPQNATSQSMTVITFDSEPGDPRPYQLDQTAKTARRVSRASAASPSPGGTMSVALTLNTNGVASARGIGPSLAGIDMPVNFQGLTIPRRGIPADLRPTEENLGSRQIDGIKATGKRTTVTIPTDRVGNDRPIQITDERWESPELGIVVLSRFSDPRTGIVEYRLTNVNRSEPAAALFQIPSDYTEVGGRGAGGVVGGRVGGGGGGGRGRGGAPPQQ